MSDPHELLPWYVNGTLGTAERANFEAHLAQCTDCRDELSVIQVLRGEMQNPDWDLLAEHPDPAILAAVSIDGEDDAATRRHLALCLTCAEEVRWLKGEASCGVNPRSSRSHAPRWALPASLAAAAVLAFVMIAGIILLPRSGGQTTGRLQMNMIPAAGRAQTDLPVIEVRKDAADVHLLFEIDLGAEEFPASFRLDNESGRSVLTIEKLEAADLYRGAFLFIVCNRSDCPDGAYTGRVSPRGHLQPDVEHPFRLRTTP